jgi:lipoprotein NlpD
MAKLTSTLVVLLSLTLLACGGSYYAPVRDATLNTSSSNTSSLLATPAQNGTEHIVQPGETLYAIAWKYQRDYQELAAINNIADPYTIQPGQTLLLQGDATENNVMIAQASVYPSESTEPSPVTQSTEPQAQPIQTDQTVQGQAAQTQENSISPTPVAAEQTPKTSENTIQEQPVIQPETTNEPPVTTTLSAAAGTAKWIWPAQGKVLRGFSKKNKGLDIQGNKGDPVYATASGQVVYSGTGLRGYGQLVIIKHSADYLSAYAHNNKILVTEGQQVNQGQQIAEIGSTGTNTTKLHFELRFKGKPVDPIKYLPSR